jgi:NAD(P)-dependent dehydrogenase (short-subunit alcohol dehydrogenase family)
MESILSKKVIVVTGGAGFLGRQFCTAVAAHGGVAVVADINVAAATIVANEISVMYPGCTEAALLDITDKGSVTAIIDLLQQKYGRIDAVVNNAYPRNRNYGRKLEDVTYEDFCENVNLHLGGYFLVAQQFGLMFREQGDGNIVNLASIYGVMAPRFEIYQETSMTMPVEYAAIKSAVIHLTHYFAKYFMESGVRVNTLSPGGILDNQPECFVSRYNDHCGKKGMLSADDVVGTLVYLLSDLSKHVTGQNLVVDDGFSL